MFARLDQILGAIAGAAAGILLTVLLYEGLPLGPLKHLPLIGPALVEIAGGRVEHERQRAREGFVQEARLAAAEAELAETRRQLAAGREALDSYAELLAAAQKADDERTAADEKRIRDHAGKKQANGRVACGLDADDLDLLLRH